MYDFTIGVRSNNFRLGLRESIAKAAEIGCKGIQLQATVSWILPRIPCASSVPSA